MILMPYPVSQCKFSYSRSRSTGRY